MSPARRASFVFLCIAPLLILPLAAARPLRVPGLFQSVGAILFLLVAASVWTLIRGAVADGRTAAGGALLVAPFALIALLWIGLGTPWDATPRENVMRYAVLLAASIAVTSAFVVSRDALVDAGARLYAALGSSASLMAGAAYAVWLSFQLGVHAVIASQGTVGEPLRSLANVYDTLLFVACALTYLTTALFARALGQAGWLGRTASAIYVVLNILLLFFLSIRGLSFPDPRALETPWYLRPGFIAGVPAIPWVMPYFLGVIMLRRSAAT